MLSSETGEVLVLSKNVLWLLLAFFTEIAVREDPFLEKCEHGQPGLG